MMGYKINDLIKSKNSQLCIGLDLVGSLQNKLEQAEKIISETADLAIAYKPNRQYWLDAGMAEMQYLTNLIHDADCAAIIDHKLTDIGSSNTAALKSISSENFDYYTLSPFPGNLAVTIKEAQKFGLGTITLVAMSNPEAGWVISSSMYKIWAQETNNYSEGIVIGATNHITPDILEEIAELNQSSFILAPGIGHQGGSMDALSKIFGERIVYNISRGISQNPDYRVAAEKYTTLIQHHSIL